MTRHILALIIWVAVLLAVFGLAIESQPTTAVALFTAVAAATAWGYVACAEACRRRMAEYRAQVWRRRDGEPVDGLEYLRVDRGR